MQEKERKKPRVLPEPPKRSPIEPIIAAEIFPPPAKAEIPSDVLGSYTGKAGPGETPTQDADDL